jgi:hypothetical protein
MHGTAVLVVDPATLFQSVIKQHFREEPFLIELEAYHRLEEGDVHCLAGFQVPILIGYDVTNRILEMTVVQQPYVLDFAQCRFDFPPDFSEDVVAHEALRRQEVFGPDLIRVEAVVQALEDLGIFHLDVSTGNFSIHQGPR